MGPGIAGRVVWHLIFCHSGIHLAAFIKEYRASTVPACMTVHPARDAYWLVVVGAVGSAMVACACATHAERLLAVIRHVPPAMALQTSGRLFLALLGVNSFLADDKSVSEYHISISRLCHNNEYVAACLIWGPTVCWLTAVCIIQGMRLFILKKNKCLVNSISPSILHRMI